MADFPTTGDDVIVGTGSGETIDALAGNDVVFGAGGNDALLGSGGNDMLSGGNGRDTLNGGNGSDWADYAFSSGDVVANLTLGYGYQKTPGLRFDKDTFVAIENINGGAGNDQLTGDDAGNRLNGNGGTDSLTGGGGKDKIDGGQGNDYIVDGAGSDVNDGGDGIDTLYYLLSPDAVTVDLATRTASGGHAEGDTNLRIENMYGSQLGDTLRGTGGGNQFVGLNGDDLLFGRGGNDILMGENDDDTLSGGGGNDKLWGSLGQDTLTGGTGIDYFNYASTKDSVPFMPDADVITDFTQGEDRIAVSLIDADTTTAGNDAFDFIGTAQYTSGVAGEIRLTFTGGDTVVSFRTDLSGTDMFIVLEGIHNLTKDDFFL